MNKVDPFGNFGWNFGFGFGWILIGVFVILMVLAIVQLVRFYFKEEEARTQELAERDSLKKELCENKISLDEFEDQLKSRA